MKRAFIFILYLIISSVPLLAQDEWELNSCILYGIKNNLTYKGYKVSEESAKYNVAQSKLGLLPSLSASSSAGMNYGRTIDPNTNTITETEYFNSSGNLSASINLFNGFVQLNQIAYSKFRLEAAKWKKKNNQDDLAFEILHDFYDVVYYQGMVQIAKDQLELSEFNLRKTQAQIDVGLNSKTDLAQMQAALESEKLDILLAENKLEEVKLNLQQKMNFPSGSAEGFNIRMKELHPTLQVISQKDSLYHSFLQISPYLKQSEAALKAEKKNVSITKGQYLPSISLNASMNTAFYQTNKDVDFQNQIKNNLNKYVGASLSIPIFNNCLQRNKVKQAKLSCEQASINYENDKQQLYYQLTNNIRELKAFYAQYIQAKKQVEADEFSFEVAQKKYNVGLVSVIELLTVKDQLVNSKSQLLLSQINWEIKCRTIDFYNGVRFWE